MSAAAGGAASKRTYSRAELEALRSAPSEEGQTRLWAEVYAALAAAGFALEYDELLAAEKPRNQRGNKGKKAAGGGGAGGWKRPEEAAPPHRFSDGGASTNGDFGAKFQNGLGGVNEPAGVYGVVEETLDEDDVEYEEDSDDDYVGILKPAFAVEGEPDFESGEPLDGFEYLRRVRWEAKQIPKVKVAKIDLSSAIKEQTHYMPEIPDIPKFSSDLRGSKQWEDTFITHFSETRLAFSQVDSYEEPSIDGAKKTSSKSGRSSEPQMEPTLTMLCNMDPVSRAATLRNYIDMIQSLDTLSRNNCLWLFALCVAVDAPLDAETCASLRSMLRKCATILATKSDIDDKEVAMLNVLMAISGRYFGQYDHRYD